MMNSHVFSDLLHKAEMDADSAVNRTLQLLENGTQQIMMLGAVACTFVGLLSSALVMSEMKKRDELPGSRDEVTQELVSASPYMPDAVTFATLFVRHMTLARQAFEGGDEEKSCFDPFEAIPQVLKDFKALTGKDYTLSTFKHLTH